MKKKADPMFRKAQLKLFSVIASILLAVFIGLLGSVNIFTQEVMDRQSESVLEQIAASLEYDEKEMRFTLSKPDDYKPKKNDIWKQEPPEKPTKATEKEKKTETTETTEETTTEETTTETTTTTAEATTEEQTDEETHAEEHHEEEHHEEQQQPQNPPQENNTEGSTSPPATQNPWENWNGEQWEEWNRQQQEYWQKYWEEWYKNNPIPEGQNPWENWNNWGQQGGDQQQWGQWGQQQWDQQQWGQQQWGQQGGQSGDPNSGAQPWGVFPWGGQSGSNSAESKKKYNSSADKDNTRTESTTTGMAFNDVYEGGIVALANTVTTEPPEKTSGASVRTTTSIVTSEPIYTNGKKPEPPRGNPVPDVEPIPQTLGKIDFFAVMADENGRYIAKLNNEDISKGTAQKYVSEIINANLSTGMLNNYQFFCKKKHNGTLMVFTDKSSEIDVLANLKRITITIGLISISVLAIASYLLSKKSIAPIKTAFERQKQFVSDASHELKTPLTVIATNADVLEGEIGENRWLGYIKSQTERMSILVNDLLKLTRLENNTASFIKTEFDMSKAVENTALPFECQAFEQNKKFIIDVDKGIMVNGSEQHIKQMAAIFIDNALKYSNDGGTVKVMLKKQGDKKIFSVYNTGQGVADADKEKIFERFYRSDASRDRSTGGYGLGLAIAKTIIDKHKFKVNVLNQEGKSICFVVMM